VTAVEKGRQRRSRIAQTLNVPQRVRLGPSLAAALLYSLFEQPEGGNYSIDPRKAFRRPCFFLLSIRLFFEPFVGFVGFRFLRGIATL
jgi:hypothetical protein